MPPTIENISNYCMRHACLLLKNKVFVRGFEVPSMRQQLYLEDSYCQELQSTVLDIEERGIKFEQTIFYPQGGGQPEDKGVIVVDGTEYPVTGIKSTADGTFIKSDAPLKVGNSYDQKIEWDYRYQLMQHHTILHILSAVVWDKFQAKVTGGTIYHDKARLDFDLVEFNKQLAQELVDEVNRIIADHHQVTIQFVDRQTAESDPELIRTKVNLLPAHVKEIRLVKIGNVDIQADGGLHVNNTSELNSVTLVKTENKGKGRKRITVSMS